MKVFYKTFGCKVNQYETELLKTRLEHSGAAASPKLHDADLCIINSCSVTHEADRECRQFVRKVLRENAHARVVVTGCYATRAPEELERLSSRVEVYSNQEKDKLPSCVGFEVAEQPLGIRHFGERSRAFLKVQDGCKAPCTYCIIPTVRNELWSKPLANVIEEARLLLNEGYQEIVLTGIRLGQYRLLNGKTTNLVELLQTLLKLPGTFRIRLSSIEVTEVSEELIRLICETPRICRHLHIPLQSGTDPVLKSMGRWYKSRDYADKIRMIRSRLPDAGLTADVMVGFPTETDELFLSTARFIEDLQLSGLHVFPFSARPGTRAAQLTPLPESAVSHRSRLLRSLDKTLRQRFFSRFQGTIREVLVETSGEGWTDNYIRVKAPSDSLPGLTQLPVAA
jgi:threonylcarbamoyladenosine tRNA methylthiotransferase MtaB